MTDPSVLHVAQIGDYGVGQYLGNLVEVQAALGWTVSVAGEPSSWLEQRVVDAGATWFDWPASRTPGPATLGEIRRFSGIARAVAPDVVHLHSSKAGVAGRLALRGRTPTIFQPHGWSFFAASGIQRRGALGWERFATRWSDAILCVSDAERRHGETEGIVGPWQVVPTAVDERRFAPGDRAEARAALGLGDEPIAICVSRLAVAHKGQDALLDAWPHIERSVAGATLLLLGEGPDRERLERAATSSVRFLGGRDDVPQWLRAANVVVQPSRYEGLSMSVLEALSCARAVVATDCVGMREAIGHGGAIVPIGDRDALVSALVDRLVDTSGADAEGANGRTRVLQNFSHEAWAASMLALTRRVAQR